MRIKCEGDKKTMQSLPPVGRVVQTLASAVLLGTTATVAVKFARRRQRRSTFQLIAAVAVGAVMTCAYTAMLFMRSIHPDDVQYAAWTATSILVLAALLLVPACTARALLMVGVSAVCITSAVFLLRHAHSRYVSHPRSWSALALCLYLVVVGTLAWALRTLACPPRCVPILRLMLAVWGLYPLVYLAGTHDMRDAWFAVLDTVVVVGFCWGMLHAQV